MESALSKQVNRELYSAYLYLSMSSYFEAANMKGFAKWMRLQAKEERMHAMKIYDYVIIRGGRVTFQDIEAPKNKWASAGKVFEDTYAHEQKVTGMINGLVDLAIQEKDHATFEMLQWFVKEQVEEEEQSLDILNKIKIFGDDPRHLFYVDHQLGKRE
jgi:ferritin